MIEFTASTALPWLARNLLDEEVVESRDGDTREALLQHVTILEPWKREILTPDRHASIVSQIAETMWVLSGRNTVSWLENYLPRAPQFSDDGEVWRGGYGPRLRNWRGTTDQLASVIRILEENPESRRAVIQIFDPEEDYVDSKDIPCNNWLSFIIRNGKLHLHVGVRSNDLVWGWSGINAFEWSTLQEMIAGVLGVQIGKLHFSTTSLHAYTRHEARLKKLAMHVGFKDYKLRIEEEIFAPRENTFEELDWLIDKWMAAEAKIRTGAGDAAEALEDFPEPMLRSWLGVIWAYWNDGDLQYVPKGGRLEAAYRLSPQKLQRAVQPVPTFAAGSFNEFVDTLHREKSAAYGGSWSRRGEIIGIMANLARKADRIGVGGGGDTAADTGIDFFVYLMLYRLWLVDELGAPHPAPGLKLPAASQENIGDNVARLLEAIPRLEEYPSPGQMAEAYNQIEANALSSIPERWKLVDMALPGAYSFAYRLWHKENLEAKAWAGYDA